MEALRVMLQTELKRLKMGCAALESTARNDLKTLCARMQSKITCAVTESDAKHLLAAEGWLELRNHGSVRGPLEATTI
jgi:hypothetical protein